MFYSFLTSHSETTGVFFFLLTGLALHIDRLHRKTARDTQRERERWRKRQTAAGGWWEAHSCTIIEPNILYGVKKNREKRWVWNAKKLPDSVKAKMSDTSNYRNSVPSFFSDSHIDKVFNYNIITHKLRDTH